MYASRLHRPLSGIPVANRAMKGCTRAQGGVLLLGTRLDRGLCTARFPGRRPAQLVCIRRSPAICSRSYWQQHVRRFSNAARDKAKAARQAELAEKNRRMALYGFSFAVGVVGICYASVPLYKIFCQATGFGGTTQRVESLSQKVADSVPPEDARPIRIIFNADVSDMMPWRFRPTQPDILVVPGETALAFYTVRNMTDKGIIGVATYNVHPPKAGLYFNKIQCFCFDEQRLKPKEEVDMPVFFFIDPDILKDPAMDNVHEITLSYTFFKTGEDDDDGVMQKVAEAPVMPVPGMHKPVGAAA